MSLSDVLGAVTDIIAYLVGGTIGSGSTATTITFANSFVGKFLALFTTSNGLLLIPVILAFTLFGIHVLKSLMGR